MPTLVELNTLVENIKLCRKLDLDFLEINMNFPQFQVEQLKQLKKSEGIEFTIHLPEELNLWNFDDSVRKAYLTLLEQVVDLALENSIKKVNMHMTCGIYITLPEQKVYLFQKYIEEYLGLTVEFSDSMSRKLAGSDTKIYIENTGIYNQSFITDALDLLLQKECFQLTWDIGHDHASAYSDSPYLMKNIFRVGHLHIHDAINTKNHLAIGSGDIDFKRLITLTKKTAETAVLETKTVEGLKQSAAYVKSGFLH